MITTDTTIRGDLSVYADDAVVRGGEDRAVVLVEPVAIPQFEQRIRAARSILPPDYIRNPDPRRSLPVRLSNFTNSTAELTAGVTIANFRLVEVETIEAANASSTREHTAGDVDQINVIAVGAGAVAPQESIKPEDIVKAIKTKDDDEARKLSALLVKYPQLFASNPKKPTPDQQDEPRDETGDAKPIKLNPYRNARVDDAHIEKEIGQLLSNNLIRRSNSPWSAPVVIVMKKGGERRTCIDYRGVTPLILIQIWL